MEQPRGLSSAHSAAVAYSLGVTVNSPAVESAVFADSK